MFVPKPQLQQQQRQNHQNSQTSSWSFSAKPSSWQTSSWQTRSDRDHGKIYKGGKGDKGTGGNKGKGDKGKGEILALWDEVGRMGKSISSTREEVRSLRGEVQGLVESVSQLLSGLTLIKEKNEEGQQTPVPASSTRPGTGLTLASVETDNIEKTAAEPAQRYELSPRATATTGTAEPEGTLTGTAQTSSSDEFTVIQPGAGTAGGAASE